MIFTLVILSLFIFGSQDLESKKGPRMVKKGRRKVWGGIEKKEEGDEEVKGSE
jgi:hypothetical protein